MDGSTIAGFDEARAETFAGRMMETLSAGAVSIMLSIGHKTGLFDTLAELPPSTSAEIAEATGLNERYVREWLAVMVTGRIVEYDPAARTYHLPPEHAATLTRAASPDNLAVFAQSIPLMGSVEGPILECFREGGGTAYGDYPCFHDFMAEDSAQTVVYGLFEHILPLVEGLEARLAEGIDVLDAGCGRGLALMAMAERYPRSRFTGYDLCGEAIAWAVEKAATAGLENVRFEARDLTGFDERERYDLICTFDAVHDQKDPAALLASLGRALRPDGTYLMQDIGGSAHLENNLDFPMAPLLYSVSCLHCMPVSLGQGGEGLGTMWGWETAERMLREAGFSSVERNVLEHDPLNVWFVSRKA